MTFLFSPSLVAIGCYFCKFEISASPRFSNRLHRDPKVSNNRSDPNSLKMSNSRSDPNFLKSGETGEIYVMSGGMSECAYRDDGKDT